MFEPNRPSREGRNGSCSEALKLKGVQVTAAARLHLGFLDLAGDVGRRFGSIGLVSDAIPPHAGLGSGTQLALAIAAAFRRLEGLPLDPREDARLLNRGARSGVGVALFERGGLAVDAGRGAKTEVPPVVAQMSFPRD